MLDFCAFFNSEQVYHLEELAKKKTSELMSMFLVKKSSVFSFWNNENFES